MLFQLQKLLCESSRKVEAVLSDFFHTFAVDEAANHNDSDPVTTALGRVRGEVRGVDGVGNDGHNLRVERCAEHRVLLAGVRDAHDVVGVAQRHGQQLVGQHGAHVGEAKEGMVGEHLQDDQVISG